MEHFYQRSVEETMEHFSVTLDSGLSSAAVEASRAQHGLNALPEEEHDSALTLFIRQFVNPLIPVLVGAFLITVFVHEYVDAFVIVLTIVISTILGFFQEYKAQEAVSSLRKLTKPHATVVRDGKALEIASEEVVVGDILILEEGMAITADARVVQSYDLAVDESVLTGESLPVVKTVEVVPDESIVNDQCNMVFSGCNVVRGEGVAVVVAIGAQTELGKIAKDISGVEKSETPLQRSLGKLSTALVVVVVVLMVFLLLLGLLRGHELYEMFLFAVSLAVSVLPEGLVIAVTIALAVGMVNMSKKNAIVRNMMAVETLGAVTVIATDKTGTLTENKLSVERVYESGRRFIGTASDSLMELLRSTVHANQARLTKETAIGDPVDVALLNWASSVRDDVLAERSEFTVVGELPFSTEHRVMATVVNSEAHNIAERIYIKGGPHEILNRSTCELVDGTIVTLSDVVREDILAEVRDMASIGLKPLAFAYQDTKGLSGTISVDSIPTDLIFLGVIGFADPLRPEARNAVLTVQKAGVRVLMLTGDHRLTANEIAKQVGVLHPENVLTGDELDSMSEEELREKILVTNVFARVTPKHKLLIIKLLQDMGEVVAMTGDGVNDAPALANADIGVAMGEGGTDVARGASDMVILDNNFVTIEAAVEEGRGIFDNLKKVVMYLLSTNISEVLVMMATLLAGMPLPLYPTQILWMNLVTDGLPDTSLIFEPAEAGVMERKPRNTRSFILSAREIERLLVLGLSMAAIGFIVFWYYLNSTDLEYARTATLVLLSFSQLINVINIQAGEEHVLKSDLFDNKLLLGGVGVSAFLQFAVVQIGFLQAVFRTVPLQVVDWGIVVVLSLSVLIVNELWVALRVDPLRDSDN